MTGLGEQTEERTEWLRWLEKEIWALDEKAQNAPAGREIIVAALDIAEFLIDKNISYGDSALNPVRIISRLSAEDGILLRIDDKLSRFARGAEYPGDDTIKDVTGYFLLLLVERARRAFLPAPV